MDSPEPHDARLGLYRFSYQVAERTIDGQADAYRDQRQEGHLWLDLPSSSELHNSPQWRSWSNTAPSST